MALAPAYDLCHAYRPGSDWVSQHCLSIQGKRIGFRKQDLLAIAKQNSIRTPEQVLEEGLEIISKWKQYASEFEVENSLQKAIGQTLVTELE